MAALYLFGEMTDKRFLQTYHYAKAAFSLFEHAVVLFLKSGISQAGQTVPAHHDLSKLHAQFKNLYPGNRFEFAGQIDGFVQASTPTPHNQFLRYPAD